MKRLLLAFSLFFVTLVLSARTVYITRHGQVGDKDFVDAEIAENKLTPLGQLQARKLADYLVTKRHFNGTILVSPFYRTIETGTYTARLLGKRVLLEPGLQEMTFSKKRHPRDGMSLKEIEGRFPGMTLPNSSYADPWRLCDEDSKERFARVSTAFQRILKEFHGDLLLVGHGASVGDLVDALNAGLPREKQAVGMPWNCILFVFELDENDKVLSAEYCTEHLDDREQTDNFKCPKIERPDDPKYWTRKYQEEYYAARSAKAAAKAYNFFFTSDTHFGDEESFEMDSSVEDHFPAYGNPRRTALCMPKYESIMAQIRAKSTASTFALINAGDFLEGFAKTPELHAAQFRKYLAFLKSKSGLKVLIVNGNHDMIGPDGAKVYAQEMNPFIEAEIGKPVDSTSNFFLWHGDDLFIFSDYYGAPPKHNSDYLLQTLRRLVRKPRYLFVVIHPNIVQFTEPHQNILREELAKHHAIVLCGHTHATEVIDYTSKEGTLTQFSCSTLLSPNSPQDYCKVSTDKEAFFALLAQNGFYTVRNSQGNPRHDYVKEFAETIAPKITRYWTAAGCGFAEIRVSDSGVEAFIYSVNPEKKPIQVKLR